MNAMNEIHVVSILYKDEQPTRLWIGEACIYKAYKWAHHHYCLELENLKLYQLPDDIKIKVHLLSNKQILELAK